MAKILCVRIGEKYGPEYETYLEKKLPEHEFIWIREPYHNQVTLQWNKMWGMQLDIDEPICVMDIDVLLVNDYKKVFDYPIQSREVTMDITSKDCRYIYDKFMSDIHKWQRYYIDNGTTRGPVNGEQYFVSDSVNEKLKIKLLPNEWFIRWVANRTPLSEYQTEKDFMFKITEKYVNKTGNDYAYLGQEFHPDIKFVHFTHSSNKPHEWKDYEIFK